MTNYSLHAAAPINPLTENDDTNSITVGTEFTANSKCWVTQIRWLRPSNAQNAHVRVGGLYRMTGANTGTLIAGPFDLPVPDLGQWGAFTLPAPVELVAGTRYRVAVFHPAGRYRAQARWFDATGTGPNAVTQTIGPVTIPNNANTNQASYVYGTALALPTVKGYQGATYFADAIISDTDPNAAPQPSIPVKVRNGSGVWEARQARPKVRTATGWAPAPLKYWDGSQWVTPGALTAPMEQYDVTEGGSIQAALTAATEGQEIHIGPGVYRLTSRLNPKRGQTLSGPSSGPPAIITGDVTLNGWVRDGSAARWYTTSGGLPPAYTDTGQCEIIAGTNANSCQKREQVWLDGAHLDRVMTLDQVAPGTFYQDYSTGRTYVGVDPAGRLVEMSKLADAINSNAPGLKLRRLRFQRFASAGQAAAVVLSGQDIEISFCRFTENHAIGLHITLAHRAWIHHTVFHRNGQLGMGHHRSHNTVVEDNMFSENNTDKFWRADWESGGFKATYSDGTVCRRNTAHNNEGIGIWFDIDNINIDCYDNTCTDNYADGIRYEISFAGKIHDNTITGNGYRYATSGGRGADISMFAVAGINVNSSPDVEIYNNTVLDNQNGISLQSRARGNSTTWPEKVRETRNAWVHHNRIRQTTGTQFGEGVAAGLNTLGQGSDTARFYTAMNNRIDQNTYEVRASADRRFSWNQNYLTFTNHQATGQDRNSTLTLVP